MDASFDAEDAMAVPQDIPLSYDDVDLTPPLGEDVTPSLQHRTIDSDQPPSLATRIGTTKVYVMPESSTGATRAGKVRLRCSLWRHSHPNETMCTLAVRLAPCIVHRTYEAQTRG